MANEAKHTPGPWKVCGWRQTYAECKTFTVWRWVGRDIERIRNDAGNVKRFRSEETALAAIAKATGAAQ